MRVLIPFILAVSLIPALVLGQSIEPDSSGTTLSTKQLVPELNESILIGYAPSISADGKTMIFEAKRDSLGVFSLYESRKNNNGNWQTPEPIESINSFGGDSDLIGGPSISFDGNTLYFFASIGMGVANDIYYSKRELDGWSTPQSIGPPINTDSDEAFPSISADGKTLYFVKINTDGPTDRDLRKQDQYCQSIVRSTLQADGTWSDPIKLPAPINVDCEKAPKIMADGKTLLFSSNRPGGKGGFDMYQSKLNTLGEWTFAVPLDYVNTDKNDQLPSISASGDLMYFVYDDKDIYTVEIPEELRQFKNNVISGVITDRDSGNGISATVTVTNAFTSEIIMSLANNPQNGAYSVVVPVGASYNLQVEAQGYSGFADFYDLRDVDEYNEIETNISLFETVHLDLNISDGDLYDPVESTITVTDREGSKTYTAKTDPLAGFVQLDLALGSVYTIDISAPNYISKSFEFDVSGLVVYRDFENDVDLMPEKRQMMINVSDLTNNSKVKSKIRLINKDRNEIIEVEGNELVSLRAGDRYEVEATSDQGYAFNSTVIDLNSDVVEDISLKLQKLEKGTLLTLKDILFESNSSQLSEISFIELQRVIKLMKENPTLKVEIAAHTDDVGTELYNSRLSEQRAQSVVQFLVDNQISQSRFTAHGYGESQPRVSNDTDENRAFNRRVELKILGV